MAKVFYGLYQIIAKRKTISFFGILLLVSALFWLASHITFEEDITKLIPVEEKDSDIQKVLQTVNFADKIIVHISKESSGSVEVLTEYGAQFLDSIHTNFLPYIKDVQGHVEDEQALQTLDFVYQNLPMFLDDEDYAVIQWKLEKDSIEKITKNNYKTLVSPTGIVAKQTILKDPLGLSFMGLNKLRQLSFGDDFTLYNGFLLSKDQNHLLLFITPNFSSSETAQNTLFADKLYSLQETLNLEYRETTVRSEYFGGALIAVENAKQIKNDIQFTVGIAMTVLLIILIVFYKRLWLPIILFVPTLFGGLVAIAVLFLIREKISAVSLGIGSVLLGVTLDYSLHVLTHIRSNSNVKALYEDITKPILMSSLTTALAFLCLLFVKSQALQDLGVFAAISVLGASVFALIFIPQVYKESQKHTTKSTWIDTLASFPLHRKKWAFILLAIGFVISVFTYSKVEFNQDISKLNYEPPALMAAQKRLDTLTNIASKSMYLAAYGNSPQDAIAANDLVFEKLSTLKEKNSIINFSSLGALVQSKEQQQSKINKWRVFWNDSRIHEVENNIIESSRPLGFKDATFDKFYALLNSDFQPLSLEGYHGIETIPFDDYISSKNGFTTVTSLVKLNEEQVEEVLGVFGNQPNVLVIDRQQMNERFLGHLKNDFNNLLGYCFLVVVLLLLLFYRSVSLTLVTMLPIMLTWFLTIGLMGLFGVQFNIFNIIISSFIFGLGIDYSIFVTNGLLHQYRTGEPMLVTYKTSIILSVITTILGVGVMIFAKHPALYTISVVSIIGILSAMIVSFTIQPALFWLFIGSKTKRPINLRLLLHSVVSFGYYGLGGLLLSLYSVAIMPLIPMSKKVKMKWFHKVVSKFMKSVLYTNPFVKKTIINPSKETFEKQAVIIANHTSFLDILVIGMLHPKIIFLVNDWVYNSPIFGKAVQLAGFYPVSSGIENGVSHLKQKVDQGYSLMAFPEGTRSRTNKIKRFHKGAFYLAEQFQLDVVPVIIHGNSEVLPKGSFVVKDGEITLKVLPRIPYGANNFGKTTREQTKNISAYFKAEYEVLRQQLEGKEYFHSIVLEDFKYKGVDLYTKVKSDLKVNAEIYRTILDQVDKRATILHLSKNCGQLDFLLSLDSPDRKIISCITDKNVRDILKSSYISNNNSKIAYVESVEELLKAPADTCILNTGGYPENDLRKLLKNFTGTQLVLLNMGTKEFCSLENYTVQFEQKHLVILNKTFTA
ncbi:1-acyl-sn-glycerol-3-phosphate acyltransferase [Mangrovimonas sp. DI 80]|uniref:1-acyl-sn-glycerol-3-phosphate acyltransferase n=1 Tax=Mangrovimonas sp. DI 80 TaxID=1779330 RepID=UPI0009757B4D|nr:1-acyl-sn-glycerol-3-phosphate acyltransferase [Mangrovimonas sp. DI 80]OMP31456.1 glycerol acyltransferase [Mangrovimonas sp. DI 80]